MKRLENVCVREASSQPALPHRSSASARAQARRGKAFRRYDEGVEAQVVQADFTPSAGMRVRFVGAPQVRLGDILVQLHLPTKRQEGCQTLQALINDVPASAGSGPRQHEDQEVVAGGLPTLAAPRRRNGNLRGAADARLRLDALLEGAELLSLHDFVQRPHERPQEGTQSSSAHTRRYDRPAPRWSQ